MWSLPVSVPEPHALGHRGERSRVSVGRNAHDAVRADRTARGAKHLDGLGARLEAGTGVREVADGRLDQVEHRPFGKGS